MADAPEPPRRHHPPGATPVRDKRKDYIGCGLWALAFLIVGIGGCAAGLALRPDAGPKETDPTTVARGGRGEGAYELLGRTDETGEPCLTLTAGSEEITGQCGYSVSGTDEIDYKATSTTRGNTTVIFGPVPDEVVKVRLRLEDGSRPEVRTRNADGLPGRFFVYEADSPDVGPTELLDDASERVRVPG